MICSAKIVPRIQITNKKGRYLGFSQKFEGNWAIFLGRCTIQKKGLRGGSPFEMLLDGATPLPLRLGHIHASMAATLAFQGSLRFHSG